MSADTEKSNRHYSIDLSLELERQLDNESLPPTPAPLADQRHVQRPSIDGPFKLPDIDPHVLAHIISQLRHQLADMTRERDDLLVLIDTAHTKEAELQDALQHITDKAMNLDEALSEARRQITDDTEAISLLRTKVEESRRGLMRLQAESRRQPTAVDTGRANAPSAFTLGPPSSRRASFTPLTGTFAANSLRPNGHHRISSVSDTNIDMNTVSSPTTSTFNIGASPPPPANNRRLSGFFGRSSPPRDLPTGSSSSSPDEIEKLRKEIRTLQSTLDETRHELTEANEAREASETCAGALRDFIAENSLGSAGAVKLPPLPAATTGGEGDESRGHKKNASGWGFKLWKDASVKGAPGPASDVTASPIIPAAANAPSPANAPPAPLARKLTGFFGSRASVSSVASSLAPLQTQTQSQPPRHARDSVYSLSDASSVAEPISPTSQVAGGPDGVRVREAAGSGSPELENEPVKEASQPHMDDALSLRSTPSVGV
ncbi:hypothetical protein DFH08DRAFT_737461 [Mycena albidolilacea]|uniref:Uncharacterized protein n=1 Tax=Mycena albidolilacea TaxID=1033008 RepID=A0AAD7EW94_9AGAR|nr:hypothetical protein DFH08DRAFT_737461 [Mycena albidolilacea]